MKTNKLCWEIKDTWAVIGAMIFIIISMAVSCTETDPKSRHNVCVTDSPQFGGGE